MISVSNEFKRLMAERTDFQETAEITLVGGIVLNLGPGDFTTSNNYLSDSAGQGSFPIGMAVEKTIQLELANWEDQNGNRRFENYNFFNARIHLSLSFDLPSAPPEIVNLGYYTVVTPEQYGDTVILTAADDMWRADKAFALTPTYPVEAGNMLQYICNACGLTAGNTVSTFRNHTFSIAKAPEKDMTYRQAIGYIAMIAGGNARIDYAGKLQILEYNPIGETTQHTLNRFISMQSLSTDDVTITGVKWTVGNGDDATTYIAGTDTYAVTITDNPFAAGVENTLVGLLYNAVGGLTFRPFDGEHTGYPIAEFMDTAEITDGRGNTYNTFLTDISFAFAGKTAFKTSAESPQRNGSSYASAAATAAAAAYQLVAAEKSSREAAIQNLAEQMAAAGGLYMSQQDMPGGGTAYYLHDQPTRAESSVIWEMNAAGWRVSSDGGQTWNAGMTVDGQLIATILNTIGVNADWIRTGIITDQYGRNVWNLNTGELTITTLPVTGVENLLYNSTGFTDTLDTNGNQVRKTSTDGWTKYGASDATLGAGKSTNTSFPGESRYYLSMYNPTSSVSYIDSAEFSLKPSTKYTISGYIGYLGAGSGASGYIRIRDLDGSEYSPIQVLTLPSSATHGSFTRFSTTITTGQKTGYGYLRFRNLGADLSGSSNYNYLRINLIDIMVSEGSVEVPWAPSTKDLVKQTYNNLSITENKISSTMAATYLSQSDAASEYATQNSMSSLTQTVDSISTTVSKKVGPNEIISKINQSAEGIEIEASKIDLRGYTSIGGGYFTVDTNGKMTATDGTFSGAVTATSGKVGNWQISGNILTGTSQDGNTIVELSSVNKAPILRVRKNFIPDPEPGELVSPDDNWQDILVMRYTGAIESYTRNSSGTQTALFKVQDGNVTTSGNINCTGNFTATNGTLTGTVTATAGTIGGLTIGNNGTRLIGTSGDETTRFFLSSSDSNAFNVQKKFSSSWQNMTSIAYNGTITSNTRNTSGTITGKTVLTGGTLTCQDQNGGNKVTLADGSMTCTGSALLGIASGQYIKMDNGITSDYKRGEINFAHFQVKDGCVRLYPKGRPISGVAGCCIYDESDDPLSDGGGWIHDMSSSSIRYKEIDRLLTAEDIEGAYAVNVYSAHYKEGYLEKDDERYGASYPMFIAEDVDENIPFAADHNRDGSVEDWNYRVMIPVMFQMLKAQRETIDKQDKEIATLEARLVALEKKLEDIGL